MVELSRETIGKWRTKSRQDGNEEDNVEGRQAKRDLDNVEGS